MTPKNRQKSDFIKIDCFNIYIDSINVGIWRGCQRLRTATAQ